MIRSSGIVLVAALATALMGATAAFAGPNLIVNGSFETPDVATNAYGLFTSAQVPGWTLEPVGTTALIEIQNINVAGTPAADGVQYAELDSNKSSRIFQNVQTSVGQQYELSWWFSPRPGTGAAQNKLGVYLNDALVATSGPQAGLSGSQNNWARYSFAFSATQSTSKVSFADLGDPSDSYGTYLDDVRLVAIPEPVFFQFGALMGLSGMGVLKLRRR